MPDLSELMEPGWTLDEQHLHALRTAILNSRAVLAGIAANAEQCTLQERLQIYITAADTLPLFQIEWLPPDFLTWLQQRHAAFMAITQEADQVPHQNRFRPEAVNAHGRKLSDWAADTLEWLLTITW